MYSNRAQQKKVIVILRGGGDLASGVALRLYHIGIPLLITELQNPLAVRRLVAFSEAITQGKITVEGVTAQRVDDLSTALTVLAAGNIPVYVDPDGALLDSDGLDIRAIIDARMMKRPPDLTTSSAKVGLDPAPLVVGLGPGFVAGLNCHAAIETNRGHYLGRVIWEGAPEPNTGLPGKVGEHRHDRVLRAPQDGTLTTHVEIGEKIKSGQPIATVAGEMIFAPFDGVVRGLLPPGFRVSTGLKIGDLDPRNDPNLAVTVSDKSLAIGGGVVEALLAKPEIRATLWS